MNVLFVVIGIALLCYTALQVGAVENFSIIATVLFGLSMITCGITGLRKKAREREGKE